MDLKKILESERIKSAKRTIVPAYSTYTFNRENALKRIDEEEFKKKLNEIKRYSISNLEKLKKKTIKNLQEQKIKVFEAKDAKEACRIILKLIPQKEEIVKSKSNTIDEIGLKKYLEKRNKLIETDCGDFIVQLCDEESSHPVTPALHISLNKIVKKIKEKHRVRVKEDPVEITHWVRNYLRKKLLEVNIGLTGANVISSDGGIFILENEGNISLVSRIPEKHIVVTGIDKIVPTIQDAVTICQAAAIWGTGSPLPGYINVISSPSKTADIQKKLVYGMHGAKEVFLILVDNGRRKIIKEGFGELLYCINCGACLYPCPIYRNILDNYGFHYFGGRGVGMTALQENIKKAFDRGLYFCTTCELCKQNCPLDIDIPKLIKKLRAKAVKKNLETNVNQEMMNNIRSMGNPFGEAVKEGKIPDKLYCC